MSVAEFQSRWLQVRAYRDAVAGLQADDMLDVKVRYALGAAYVISIVPVK
jgi:hypothetical protein